MNEASNPVTDLQSISDGGAHFLDDAAVVTTDNSTLGREEVDAFPVGRIESHSDSLDFDVVVAQLWNGSIRDKLGQLWGLNLDCSLQSHSEEGE